MGYNRVCSNRQDNNTRGVMLQNYWILNKNVYISN
jgi:hypothetical protein